MKEELFLLVEKSQEFNGREEFDKCEVEGMKVFNEIDHEGDVELEGESHQKLDAEFNDSENELYDHENVVFFIEMGIGEHFECVNEISNRRIHDVQRDQHEFQEKKKEEFRFLLFFRQIYLR